MLLDSARWVPAVIAGFAPAISCKAGLEKIAASNLAMATRPGRPL